MFITTAKKTTKKIENTKNENDRKTKQMLK